MRTLMVVVLVILIPVSAIHIAPSVREAIYEALRQRELLRVEAATSRWESISSEHIELRFKDDAEGARVVLDVAEQELSSVLSDIRVQADTRVLVLVYSTREELRDEFGWSASEDAMGVYFGGVVRVLSPRAWVNSVDIDVLRERFRAEGPLAHEFTHLVLDELTEGNYPRWFSEGVAQYEEYMVSGYMWIEPGARSQTPFYSYADLDRGFEDLPDQAKAYRQAFLMVYYLVTQHGWDKVLALVASLQRGTGFGAAMQMTYGFREAELSDQWSTWVSRTVLPPLDLHGGTV